jgi:hypothetical protein
LNLITYRYITWKINILSRYKRVFDSSKKVKPAMLQCGKEILGLDFAIRFNNEEIISIDEVIEFLNGEIPY